MEKEFYIGDRVCLIQDHPANSALVSGATGTIRSILKRTSKLPYGIEWDEDFACGHNLRGEIKNHRGWYVGVFDIKLEAEEADYDIISASDQELSLLLCG